MWNKLKDFIFEKPEDTSDVIQSIIDGTANVNEPLTMGKMQELYQSAWVPPDPSITIDADIILSALAHYCRYCDTGFRNRGSTKNHIRLKHPEHYASTTTSNQLPQTE